MILGYYDVRMMLRLARKRKFALIRHILDLKIDIFFYKLRNLLLQCQNIMLYLYLCLLKLRLNIRRTLSHHRFLGWP